MPIPRFERFVFDDENERKFLDHGLTPHQVASMLYRSDYQVRLNRNARSGLYLLIGRDFAGRCVACPVEATDIVGTWRPATAWYCKPSEEHQLP